MLHFLSFIPSKKKWHQIWGERYLMFNIFLTEEKDTQGGAGGIFFLQGKDTGKIALYTITAFLCWILTFWNEKSFIWGYAWIILTNTAITSYKWYIYLAWNIIFRNPVAFGDMIIHRFWGHLPLGRFLWLCVNKIS